MSPTRQPYDGRAAGRPNLDHRHDDELAFWNKVGTGRLQRAHDYRIPDLSDHVRLFGKFEYLRPVIEFWGDIQGATVLDLGCGNGWLTLSMAKSGAIATGVDISPALTEFATRLAQENGLAHLATFASMPAEALTFADESYDLVIMHAALHHCEIDKAGREVHRVLKRGGRAVFIEDYAYHPLLKLYRALSKSAHTRFEQPLTDDDVAALVSRFSSHELRYYGLLNMFHTSRTGLVRRCLPLLSRADDVVMSAMPWTRRYAKLVAIWVTK